MVRKATDKEVVALKEYYDPRSDSHLNMQESVKKAYDTSSDHSAAQIGYEIKQRLSNGLIKLDKKSGLSQFVRENLTEDYVLTSLLKLSMGESPNKSIKLKGSDIMKAVELLSKYRSFNGLLKDTQVHENKDMPQDERELDQTYTQLIQSN